MYLFYSLDCAFIQGGNLQSGRRAFWGRAMAEAEKTVEVATADGSATTEAVLDDGVAGINGVDTAEEGILGNNAAASNTDDDLLRQVEFYFSDSNLPVDKFLWQLTTKNEGGWIEIATICSFKRMRALLRPAEESIPISRSKPARGAQTKKAQPFKASADEIKRVAEIISGQSSTLEVDSTSQKVKRKIPFDAAQVESSMVNPMSVYVKGFTGPEAIDSPALQVELEKFFNSFGRTRAVRMRRYDPNYKPALPASSGSGSKSGPSSKAKATLGAFKGSVFAQFEDVETAKRFLALDPPPKWKEQDLLIMAKEAYLQKKADEKGIPMTVIEARNRPAFDGTKHKTDDGPKRGDKRKRGDQDERGGKRPKRDGNDRRGNDRRGNFDKKQTRGERGKPQGKEAPASETQSAQQDAEKASIAPVADEKEKPAVEAVAVPAADDVKPAPV